MDESSRSLSVMNVELAVRERYSKAVAQCDDSLCCPTSYSPEFLAVLPAEVVERDYGCGDPTKYVHTGETVVDLGSGAGKACFIMAQIVGPKGRVIGVDCNLEMLALARRHRQAVAERLGYANVEFRCGMIQDLRLDLDRLASALAGNPVADQADWLRLRDLEESLRRTEPMIADVSVDCVVSNCVLNLVRREDRRQLLSEVFRVLKPGGRAAISDIVANCDVPESLQRDPQLWSGCISGAEREDRFVKSFAAVGFDEPRIETPQTTPWRIIEGIEFRAVTVIAQKGATALVAPRNTASRMEIS
ncbi:MAG: methyltransferase domain-containing protein [Planctomycetaceae bacterium]|nr:methyltransferase domain-containing protein [Planctomycetaceae bacterium]